MAEIAGAVFGAAVIVLGIALMTEFGIILGLLVWALFVVLPAYLIGKWLWHRVSPR